MVEISREEVEALKRFLTWMRGFEESVLYEDYRRYEGFTDEEYAKTVNTLWNVVKRAETKKHKETRIEIKIPDLPDLSRDDIERFEDDLKEFLSGRLREFGVKAKVINHATGDESTVYPMPICPECGRPLKSIKVDEFGRSLLFNHETELYVYGEDYIRQVYKCPECGKVIGEKRKADGEIWGFVPETE